MKIKFNLVSNDGQLSSVTAIRDDGAPLVALASHPTFQKIVDALAENERKGGTVIKTDDDLLALFDVEQGLRKAVGGNAMLTDRVTIENGVLYIDRDPFSDPMAERIVKSFTDGADFMPMVRFLEKTVLNPNKHSREMMFKWLDRNHFVIAEDGDILAYKGVNRNADGTGYKSVSSGTAWVNGVKYFGLIPTSPGSVVEMPRSAVNHNPSVGCSTGLHAGDWTYASTFASSRVTVLVKINPRDVVSVPTDSQAKKMRVCRYLVLNEVSQPVQKMTVSGLDDRILVNPPDDGKDAVREEVTTTSPAKKRAAKRIQKAKAEAVRTGQPVPDKHPVPTSRTTKKAVKKAASLKAGAKTSAAKTAERLQRLANGEGKFYEDYRQRDFEQLTIGQIKWVLDQWEVTYDRRATKVNLVKLVAKAAENRRRKFNRSITPLEEKKAATLASKRKAAKKAAMPAESTRKLAKKATAKKATAKKK